MKKIKLSIKTWSGTVLFEYETEDNTIRKTVEEAVRKNANLRSADLRYADLSSANLRYADLRSANLRYAKKLPQSFINQCSRDMLFIFQSLPSELPFLRDKLIKGEVDGQVYEGNCACLIVTLANADGGIDKVCEVIPYYDKGLHNFAEQWFYQIKKGDTPKTNQFAKQALLLIDSVLKPKNARDRTKKNQRPIARTG